MLGEFENAVVKHLPVSLWSHRIFISPKLPLPFLYLYRNTVHVFYFLNDTLAVVLTSIRKPFQKQLTEYIPNNNPENTYTLLYVHQYISTFYFKTDVQRNPDLKFIKIHTHMNNTDK